ncbi:hypothetical protein BET04_04820 [Caminicella sporogenes]|nr:hypothetical protein BET04_04820 [Caminicella sporogenes]
MSKFSKNIHTLLASEIFINLLCSKSVKLAELYSLLNILIKSEIPFDLSFSPGTRRTIENIKLVIYINPTTTIDFIIKLETGGNIFNG